MNCHLAFRVSMPIVLLCVAGPGILRAQHADVLIQQSNGVLVTGNANFDTNTWTTGQWVFSGEFDGDFAVNDPGFNALAAGSPSMPPGTQPLPGNTPLGWDFLAMTIAPLRSNLFYWNGLESDGQPGITVGDVLFGALPLPSYTLSLFDKTNTAFAVNGASSDVAGGIIDDTAADGSLHRHRFYFLQDNDGNGATVPADGIYLLAMRMKMTGLERSQPIFMVFGTPGSSIAALDDAAFPWVQARVDTLVPLVGDYNQNGTVDAADYVAWRSTLGQTGIGLAADGDSDNQVDSDDYVVWRNNFGQSNCRGRATNVLAAAVPEPSMRLLSLTGIVGILLGWRCRIEKLTTEFSDAFAVRRACPGSAGGVVVDRRNRSRSLAPALPVLAREGSALLPPEIGWASHTNRAM